MLSLKPYVRTEIEKTLSKNIENNRQVNKIPFFSFLYWYESRTSS